MKLYELAAIDGPEGGACALHGAPARTALRQECSPSCIRAVLVRSRRLMRAGYPPEAGRPCRRGKRPPRERRSERAGKTRSPINVGPFEIYVRAASRMDLPHRSGIACA